MFEWLETPVNLSGDLVGGIPELISATSSVGQDDSEKYSRLPTPVLSKGVTQSHDIGAKRLLDKWADDSGSSSER